MTQYGPATGNYSAASIKLARDKQNAKAGDQIINGKFVDNTGGTNNYTNGGGYSGGSAIGSGISGRPDTQSIYDATIAAKNALLQQQYNKDKNLLENAYTTNMTNANLQKGSVEQAYNSQVDDIKENTYNELQRSKEIGVMRGITNSALGRSQDQTMLRAGYSHVNDATTERNRVINELTTKINDLTKIYGKDNSTLEANLGQGKLQAMSEAQLSKLNADLDLYKFDADWANKFKMQDTGFAHDEKMQISDQAWKSMESNLDRTQQMAIAKLSSETQLKAANISAGGQIAAAKLAQSGQMELAKIRIEAESQLLIKGWEREDASAAADRALQYQTGKITSDPNYNPSAKLGFWDTFWSTPWYQTQNTKSVDLNKQMDQLYDPAGAARYDYTTYMYDSLYK